MSYIFYKMSGELSNNIEQQFKNLYEEFNLISKKTKDLIEGVKILQKTCKTTAKQVKAMKKKTQVKLDVSSDLEKFLSLEKGTKITKAEAMQGVSDYIKANNLQLQDDRRKFKPNKQLNKIFGMNVNSSLTFVEINKHVSSHLTK